jgi:NAD(P)H-hydrate epimerase
MKELEKQANSAGFPYAEMMRTAGEGIAAFIIGRFGRDGKNTAVGLIGKGNNGGDTLIAITSLQQAGWNTLALLVGERGSKDPLLAAYTASGGVMVDIAALRDSHLEGQDAGIILDGVYGTGFHPPLPDPVIQAFKSVHFALPKFTWIAVDCPSGVDCETGEVSPGTPTAKWTISLEAVKNGLLTETGFPYCGEFAVVDLGLTRYDTSQGAADDIVADDHFLRETLPLRQAFSHKGSYGKTLVVGGSVNYPGAPVLAGRAAYAVGTGLVQVAVPESIGQTAPVGNPELTWLILEDGGGIISELAAETLRDNLPAAHSIVIGPGMGRENTTQKFISRLLLEPSNPQKMRAGFAGMSAGAANEHINHALPPTVIDADGLYHLSKEGAWQDMCRARLVLTPHPGEMALLSGLSVEEIQTERIRIAKEYARMWNQVVVLKGALTVVAEPGGKAAVVPIASASLAKAGTGDVLAGIIGGLLAQSIEPWQAAAAGAYMHARAGLFAEETVGCSESVLASDVIRAIPRVYQVLKTSDLP